MLLPLAPDVKLPTVTQRLVEKCTSFRDLRIPMFSNVIWTDDLIKANLQHMETIQNLQSLTILAFDINYPNEPNSIPSEYLSMWLCQVPSLPRLETMTICVALRPPETADRPCPWPSMPRLHCLHFDYPF